MTSGLYLVSTPIGNLEDITLRAIRILSEVNLIVAEDTRRTGVLLKHYNIKKPLLSYHDHNKITRIPIIIDQLKSGAKIAFVSDSGTPGIADPCFHLVQKAIESNIPVIPIPGPTSVTAALVVSGLPTDRFIFEGWLPKTSVKRKKKLEALSTELRTIIFFESPHRIVATLKDCLLVLGNRRAAICRELTKKFETIERERLEYLVAKHSNSGQKGEFVVLIEGAIGSSPFGIQ
ncbi:MAG: 16S rRNA (cytidine(1402)-2'-O)-methyltransferase [Candidatus Stahlbacteria bacterium]|nr:16S rRNA (cytidine(1402)-2'-O)-methyltransferase [Candidatus Stahlbacteria bacterium]